MAPLAGAREQLTRLVYELLDAHDDTARIATGQDSTSAGRLISAICTICSESRASCSRMRANKRAHKLSRLLTLGPERRECFGVSGVCLFEYHLSL
jgi:hypothetical protein